MRTIEIYDRHKRLLGTATYEFDDEAPLRLRNTLDGAPIERITDNRDGWFTYWVNWRDKNTGKFYSSVYVKAD